MKTTLGIIAIFFFFTNANALDYLKSSIKISTYGLLAQQNRLQIVAQNLALKDTVSTQPGGDPYRRQVIILNTKFDKKLGAKRVFIKKYDVDKSEFKKIYDPNHPGADANGYVKYPNVNIHIENADSKDAARSYEANLSMIDLSKNMFNKTLDIIK